MIGDYVLRVFPGGFQRQTQWAITAADAPMVPLWSHGPTGLRAAQGPGLQAQYTDTRQG
jgi:hypothetical protein